MGQRCRLLYFVPQESHSQAVHCVIISKDFHTKIFRQEWCAVPRICWTHVQMNNSCFSRVKNIWRKIPNSDWWSHLSGLFVFVVREKMKRNNDPFLGFWRGFIRKEQISDGKYKELIFREGTQWCWIKCVWMQVFREGTK